MFMLNCSVWRMKLIFSTHIIIFFLFYFTKEKIGENGSS